MNQPARDKLERILVGYRSGHMTKREAEIRLLVLVDALGAEAVVSRLPEDFKSSLRSQSTQPPKSPIQIIQPWCGSTPPPPTDEMETAIFRALWELSAYFNT